MGRGWSCRAGWVFLSLRAGMWTGQAANLSPWSPRLWLPFPLGIPKPRAPALGDFPVLSFPLDLRTGRVHHAHLAGREGMKIPGIWGGAASSQVLESLPFMALPYEICCIFAFLKLCALCVQDQGALSSIPSWTWALLTPFPRDSPPHHVHRRSWQ